jgi:hypothetical protein
MLDSRLDDNMHTQNYRRRQQCNKGSDDTKKTITPPYPLVIPILLNLLVPLHLHPSPSPADAHIHIHKKKRNVASAGNRTDRLLVCRFVIEDLVGTYPGASRIDLKEMATANFTTKPPMLMGELMGHVTDEELLKKIIYIRSIKGARKGC